MFGGGSVVPTIKSGKLRGLASTGTVRNPATPELPTIAEVYPGYEALSWHGVFVPAGTPQPIVDRLRNELKEVAAQPEFKERLANTGSGEPWVVSPEELSARIKTDYEKYGKLIRSIGVSDELAFVVAPSPKGEAVQLPPHPADDRADDDECAEPGDAVDHREHRPTSVEGVVGRQRGDDEAEPAQHGRYDAAAQRECVHVHEEAVQRPGDDDLGDENHNERRHLRRAGLCRLFGLALLHGLALSREPRTCSSSE